MNDLSVELYDKIQFDAAPTIEEIDGRKYSSRNIFLIKTPKPETLCISTLDGLKEYINENLDKLDHETVAIVIESPTKITVRGPIDQNSGERALFLNVSFIPPAFNFDRFYEIEEFIVALQAKFKMTENLAALLAMIGNITGEEVKTSNDDGISQSVVVSQGVKMKGRDKLPNPIALQPIRSFYEIEPVESKFVFRAQKRDNHLPLLCLFDGDAGAWDYETKFRIKAYLEENLNSNIMILV